MAGYITGNVVAGNNIIHVSDSVIQNAEIGIYLILSDGDNKERLGYIHNIDRINGTVETELSPEFNHNYQSPTYVSMELTVLKDIRLTSGQINIGFNKIGGSYVKENTIIRIKYNNRGNITKNFYGCIIEYLY
jgi:hypothetical protein